MKGDETLAIYRNVQLSFWTDSKISDSFTPEDRFFYLYLITNPQSNICGCYEISYAQFTNQTGYNKDTVNRLIERFESVHKVIRFCKDTKEILLLNWYKYNWNRSEKTLAGVENVAKYIKTPEFRDYVLYVIDCIRNDKLVIMDDTPIMGHTYPIQASVSVSVPDSGTVSDADMPERQIKGQKRESTAQILERLLEGINISEYLLEYVNDWLAYKKERNFTYKETGLKNLLKSVQEKSQQHGDEYVAACIRDSIASGYQGITYKAQRGSPVGNGQDSEWVERWKNA